MELGLGLRLGLRGVVGEEGGADASGDGNHAGGVGA